MSEEQFAETSVNPNAYSLRWWKRTNKTHYYTQVTWGCDCIFEPIDGGSRGYMTGQGRDILEGDYITVVLKRGANPDRFRVEKVDYYSNPPDMWIALLNKVSS